MAARGHENPTSIIVVIKLLAFFVLLTSVSYLAINAWSIVELAKQSDSDHSDAEKTAHFSCQGITIILCFIQAVSSFHLLFTCTSDGNLRKHSRRWIIVQALMVILVFLAFLVPFTIDKNGEQTKLPEFWNKTQTHLVRVVDGVKMLHFHKPHNTLTYGVVVHGGVVVISCIVVGIMSLFATNSYTVVR